MALIALCNVKDGLCYMRVKVAVNLIMETQRAQNASSQILISCLMMVLAIRPLRLGVQLKP